MKKRFLALILAGIMLCSAACSNNTQESNEQDSRQSTEAEDVTVETEEETTGYLDSLPDSIDLGGETVSVFGRVIDDLSSNEVSVEELNGEVINDAVFTRQLNLENRLNCKMLDNVVVMGGDAPTITYIDNAIMAADENLEILCLNGNITSQNLLKGALYDLRSLDYLDFSKPYWSQKVNDTATVAGKQYFATGYLSLGLYRNLMPFFFNKTMFGEYGFEFPYTAVLEEKWTLDAASELIEKFYVDVNGDGIHDADDRYGFYIRAANDTDINDGFWAAMNLIVMSKDENDLYYLDIDEEWYSNAFDHLLAMYNKEATYTTAANNTDIYNHFINGKTAMITSRMFIVESVLRDMEDDFGVLPIPKVDETQEDYYSMAQDQFIVYSIPVVVNTNKVDSLALFLEAYASESERTIKPAYYDTALTTKFVNDAESAKMIDIVVDNLYLDPSVFYWTKVDINIYLLRDTVNAGQNNVASLMAKKIKVCAKQIEKINTAIQSFGN